MFGELRREYIYWPVGISLSYRGENPMVSNCEHRLIGGIRIVISSTHQV